jgi:triacylglycerol lipase
LLQHGEVASITTIATPHHGTALARNLLHLPAALRGFSDLSGKAMEKWECPDVPAVLYFSIGGAAELSPLHPLYLAQHVLYKLEPGPNDGLVTVASSRYGNYLFTTPLDHWAQIGWTSHMDDSHIRLLYRPILDNLTAHRI